ncbi:MAG TPA: UbiA-like polyprenyltransferase [Leptospiraceae bacterium]|nr:putative 4-hydroxybenzoate polyprenyltransferase [Leptospirales bacterium]HMU85137.1 UbiA-like polyprenyltransferase [Leptospiraceae bacterium]HMW58576.1 UbiA-like polyprenyltransferase [Leptospiraceae bacterium]HMX55893.1 UbiA-like polyprenyltransferase [Leptospiraceae bacterium]HMY46245.1 UbiA-like polyprenyltransferase [Leptospiraceae bacterium]
MNGIATYLRMIKFSHTIFALPFAGIAFIQALPASQLISNGVPGFAFYRMLVLVIVCMVSLRSAAMGFNRLADRNIDAVNPRTRMREIPSGALSVSAVRSFVIISLVLFVVAAFAISTTCGLLSPIAAGLVLGYSYTKRFTWLCHFVLGTAIGQAPAATALAMTGSIPLSALAWSGGLALYIGGFDILYACQDAEFDRSQKLHSIPSRFGIPTALWIARISHILALCLFAFAAISSQTGLVFFAFLFCTGILFLVEHALVRPNRLEKIPIAFFNVNASISTVLFAGLLVDLWIRIPFFH